MSYATTAYHEYGEALERSLLHLGLDYAITYYGDQPTWRYGCGRKPQFLLDHLHEYRRPCVWIDADACVLARPDLLLDTYPQEEVDFACWFSSGAKADLHPFGDKGREILNTGTMFWNFTHASLDLLGMWAEAEHGQYVVEQRVLGEIWHGYEGHIKWERLPQRYCKIKAMKWGKGEDGPPVIEHYVYSFKYGRNR